MPILLTAPLTGGITGALVVVAILMLWSGPARDWFAGRPVRELQVPGRPDKSSKQGPWETTMPRESDRLHQPLSRSRPAEPDPTDRPSDRPTPPASQLTTAGSVHRARRLDRVRGSPGSGRRPPAAVPGRRPTADPMAPGQWHGDLAERGAGLGEDRLRPDLGLLRRGRADVRRRAGRAGHGPGPDRRLRGRPAGVAAGQPAGGHPRAGALARRAWRSSPGRSVPACSPGSPGAGTTGRAGCSRPAPLRRSWSGCSPSRSASWPSWRPCSRSWGCSSPPRAPGSSPGARVRHRPGPNQGPHWGPPSGPPLDPPSS